MDDGAAEKADYWSKRSDMLYYQYFRYMIRCIGAEARSLADVGSHNAPYLEWFDWIPEKVSIDLKTPYSSDAVRGLVGDIREMEFPERFDVCTCLQVLEHVPEPAPFARRLLEIGRLVLVSVPFRWPAAHNPEHVNDPIDRKRIAGWFGRPPNYQILVREPFMETVGVRLFALFDVDKPERRFGPKVRRGRRPA